MGTSTHEAVRERPEGLAVWSVPRPWRLAKALPVGEIAVSELRAFDADCWFRGEPPTCRAVAEHARRIYAADLRHPVLLAADGSVFDGLHRVARAYLEGRATVRYARFPVDPPPDRIEPVPAPGGPPSCPAR